MKLQPASREGTPSYPTRKATLLRRGGRWVRKVGAVVALSAAATVGMSGCFLVEVAGGIGPVDYWTCADEPRDPVEIDVPGTFVDTLCEDVTTWGYFEVGEQTVLRFSFDAEGLLDPSAISADIVDPEGAVVATVVPGEPAIVTVTPGEWQIGVTSVNFEEGDFTVNIDLVHDR